jgi:hypothetical protein
MNEWAEKLEISQARLVEVNRLLTDAGSTWVKELFDVIRKYGNIEEINEKAGKAGNLSHQIAKLHELGSPYVKDLDWLKSQRDRRAFTTLADYRRKILGDKADRTAFRDDFAVTLEISAMQYFPWLIKESTVAIERQELMPSRFTRVRTMKEQVEDHDLIAVGAAMNIVGASYVETLDTKGTDGSNVHLGGSETITGYFGGIGQPNDHALKWVDEFLFYYTQYGVRQVLNVNSGTILLGYLLHKLGIDNEFKISVFMGKDNPYAVLWTLIAAKLFSRDNGTTPLIGFNFSNSVNNRTIELSAEIRGSLGLEDFVRFEQHIIEAAKSIVRQPYDRREDLLELAAKVRNISAKHEGGDVEVEKTREHPSDILDYFRPKADVIGEGLWDAMQRNYLDKHDAVNHTAHALTEKGLSVIPAWNLHEGVPGR